MNRYSYTPNKLFSNSSYYKSDYNPYEQTSDKILIF